MAGKILTLNKTPLYSPFLEIYQQISKLQNYPRYLGAFIFGSVARGEATKESDVDTQVVTDTQNLCTNINHPIINGKKLDITFISQDQLETRTLKEIEKADRIPMVAESLVIFDKNGKLTTIREKAMKAKPKPLEEKDYQLVRFMFYHANDKAKRSLESDPISSILSMNININDLLKYYYQLKGKWWVSNKRLFADLSLWDQQLSSLLKKFSLEKNVKKKFSAWSLILDYMSQDLGEWRDISTNNCNCEMCTKDLQALLNL